MNSKLYNEAFIGRAKSIPRSRHSHTTTNCSLEPNLDAQPPRAVPKSATVTTLGEAIIQCTRLVPVHPQGLSTFGHEVERPVLHVHQPMLPFQGGLTNFVLYITYTIHPHTCSYKTVALLRDLIYQQWACQ